MSSEVFTATERLYLTADGKRVVKGDDPARHELLVVEGGTLPVARAKELGLVGDAAPREAPHEASPAHPISSTSPRPGAPAPPGPTKEGPAPATVPRGKDR